MGGLCGNLLGNATIESITNGMNVEGNRHVGGIVGIAVGNCIPDGGGYTWGNSILGYQHRNNHCAFRRKWSCRRNRRNSRYDKF